MMISAIGNTLENSKRTDREGHIDVLTKRNDVNLDISERKLLKNGGGTIFGLCDFTI